MKEMVFFVCVALVACISGCSRAAPRAIGYEDFNSKVERVPDLINSKSEPVENREIIVRSLEDGRDSGVRLSFLRLVRGSSHDYYVFQIDGLDDRYVCYVAKDGKVIYSFSFAGEANPQF